MHVFRECQDHRNISIEKEYWVLLHQPSLTLFSVDTHFNTKQQTAFENIVGKEDIALKEQFLLFPQCFLLNQKIVAPFVNIYDMISLIAAELEESKISM